jgi:Flp pilus assembly protein TadG
VFVVFFVLLYGILTYGLIFAAQQTVNLAAQDGARALLRWSPANTSVVDAKALAQTRLQWLAAMGSASTSMAVFVCGGPVAVPPVAADTNCAGGDALDAGQFKFVVRYSYGASPLIPSIPLLGGLITPPDMVLQAAVVVDPGYSNGAATAIGV